jgi:4'-phosphopantetheinyl transferase
MTVHPELPGLSGLPELAAAGVELRDVAALVVLTRTAGPADLDPHGWPSLLGAVLGALGVDAARWEIRRGPTGRPFALDATTGRAPRWTFNASHSEDLLALSLAASGHIGIDVQRVPEAGWERIARRWLHPAEVAALPADPDAAGGEFSRVWSIREACCKATGTGLAGFAGISPVGATGRGRSGRVWWREITTPPGYTGAVAWHGSRARQLARLPVLTCTHPAGGPVGHTKRRS